MVPSVSRDSTHSRDRERLIEHLFLSRLLREAWTRRRTTIEVLRPEVDAAGYDLVLDLDGVVRHVQLKASKAERKPGHFPINVALTRKPAGCVLWVEFADFDLEEKMYLRYRFYGGGPDEKLNLGGFPVGHRTTPNIDGVKPERPSIRDLPTSAFRELRDIREVYEILFDMGPRPGITSKRSR